MPMRRENVAAALRYLQDKADLRGRFQRATSLDPQEQDLADVAVDIAAGFTPLQYPQAARDFERARREGDPLGMGLATLAAVPVVGGVAKVASKARKGVDIAAERAEALATAQLNAAKPISEGGLGLRPDNTPMERAEAMGFTAPGYHGTTGNVRNFEKQYRGSVTNAPSAKRADFAASQPQVAVGYSLLGEGREFNAIQRELAAAEQARNWNKVEELTLKLEELDSEKNRLRDLVSDTKFAAEQKFGKTLDKYGVQQDFYSYRPEIGDIKEESAMVARRAAREDAYNRALKRLPNAIPSDELYKRFEQAAGGKVLWDTVDQYRDIAKRIEAKDPELGKLYRASNEGGWENLPEFQKDPNALKELNEAFANVRAADAEYYALGVPSGANVMPLMLRTESMKVKDFGGARYRDESYNELIKAAQREKRPGVIMRRTFDPGQKSYNEITDIYAITDPSRIRSRFAAFDPAKITSPDLLAGVAGPTVLAAALMEQERRKKERKETRL